MTRAKVRYYLHNLDGLKQDIADINADLEQYRAMSSESFLVNSDPDVIPNKPDDDGSQHNKYTKHSNVEQLAVSRADFIARLEQELFEKKTILAAINCVLYYLNGYDRRVDRLIVQYRYGEHLPWKAVKRQLDRDGLPYDIDSIIRKDRQIVDEIISNYIARIK